VTKTSSGNPANPNQPQPTFHVHQPGTTINQAVQNAKAHVNAVNQASKRK
jgi:hypothetical protein